MNVRTIVAAAALACAPALLGATAPPPGFRSTGTLVVQANIQGSPINVGGNVALYHKGALYRLDLLSLGFPGTDPGLSALAASLIGPGGVSLLYDGASGRTVAWSTANRTFYEMVPARPAGATAPTPRDGVPASAGPSDPLSALAGVARALQNVQSATIARTGHATVNGHPTTDIDIAVKRQLPGKPAEDYHAQLALADDLGDFPVQIALASTPTSPQAFGGTMKLDLTQIQPDLPADTLFAVPAGYTRTTSLSGVLRAGPPR